MSNLTAKKAPDHSCFGALHFINKLINNKIMWTKTITSSKIKGIAIPVLVVFLGENDDDKPYVELRSMFNEWILCETITFESRDCVYDYIKSFNVLMANKFLKRTVFEMGGVEHLKET